MKKETKKIFLMVAVITAVTGLPYIKEGLCAYFPDLMYHLLRIEGVKDALVSGRFPAAVYTNFYNGYGYGSPLFYPDLFLLFPAVLRMLSVSPVTAWKLFALLLTALAALSTWLSMKYISKSPEYSAVGTFLVMLSQFYLADLHLRAGISEYMAFIFIPILTAGIYDFFACEGKKTCLMGIGFSGLLLSHSIATLIAVLITAVIFIRMLFVKRENLYLLQKDKMKRLVCTALWTVGITAYYLFPMLEQMSCLELRYSEPWAKIGKNTQPFLSFFRLTGNFSTIAYVGIGVPVLLLIVLCLAVKKNRNRWAAVFFYGGLGLYLIMTDLVPWKLFENTLLNMIQFTYRFWPYAQFFVVLGMVMIFSEHMKERSGKAQRLLLSAVIGCAVLAGIYQNRMTAWVPSDETKMITEAYLEEHNNYSGAGEWLPLSLEESVTELCAAENVVSDSGEELTLKKGKDDYRVTVGEQTAVYTFPLIYYKGYGAKLLCEDGSEILLSAGQSEKALVQVCNETGMRGEIVVAYDGTLVQKGAYLVTLGTWIVTAAYAIVQYTKKKRGSLI